MNPADGPVIHELCRQLRARLAPFQKVKIAVCPPFTALGFATQIFKETRVAIGAQDLYWEDAGAFTGEISAPMLKSAGCAYVIVGHSERRQHFGETNENVHRKAEAALKHDLSPIICVGETLSERESGALKDVVREQVSEALRGMNEAALKNVVIAYEPVWAIGTGKTATPGQAQEMHLFIRELVAEIFSRGVADSLLILYGGSVKPDNATNLLHQPDIDGALVGGASIQAEAFAAIVRSGDEIS